MATRTAEQTQSNTITIDANTAVFAVNVGLTQALIVWAMMIKADVHGSGHTTVNALLETLNGSVGISDIKSLQRNLRKNNGILWNYNGQRQTVNRAGKSRANVGAYLLRRAIEENPQNKELYMQNKPGGKFHPVVIDVSGTIGEINARIYGAWVTAQTTVKITRAKLSALFNVSSQTLRNWEKDHQTVDVAYDFHLVDRKQYEASENPPELPEHHYINRDGNYVYQGPNTYTSDMKQSSRFGQSRRIRKTVNSIIDPVESYGAMGEKQYFASEEKLKRHTEKYGDRDGMVVWIDRVKTTDHYTGSPRNINYHLVHIATSDKNLTHIRRNNKYAHVLHTPTHVHASIAHTHTHDTRMPTHDRIQAQAQPVHATHERTHVTRQPVTASPATTDNRQSSTRNRQPVTVNPPELVHASINPSAVGTMATLTPTRLRILPDGMLLWEPSTRQPVAMPEGVTIWNNPVTGESWLVCREPERVNQKSLFASCPDLTRKRYDTALTRRREHSDRIKSWQQRNIVRGATA